MPIRETSVIIDQIRFSNEKRSLIVEIAQNRNDSILKVAIVMFMGIQPARIPHHWQGIDREKKLSG